MPVGFVCPLSLLGGWLRCPLSWQVLLQTCDGIVHQVIWQAIQPPPWLAGACRVCLSQHGILCLGQQLVHPRCAGARDGLECLAAYF